MIRWTYLLPRLALVLLAFAIVQLGVPPLLRWVLVRSLESSTGTEVELAKVSTSLTRSEMQISGLQIARRSTSQTNVFQFDSARLALDVTALTHQRCVVDRAEIRGLRFNTPRDLGSAQSHRVEIAAPDLSDLARQGQRESQQWLQQVASILERRVEGEFESIPLARRLAQRWPEDYRQLREQARQLQRSSVELHQVFTDLSSQSDTLNQISELQRRWPEVLQLRQEIAALHRRAAQLAGQIELDRRSIDTAVRNDRENLQKMMKVTELNGTQLSDYLLNGEVRRWWVQLKPWLEFASWMTDAPDANELGSRGQVVRFDTVEPEPSFLIRAAHLDGQLNLAGQQVDFVGQARDLILPGRRGTEHFDHPTQLKLVTRGPFTAQFYTRFDTVERSPRQLLALKCDDLPLPERSWGGNDGLSISVAPGTVQIQARLVASEGRLDGRLRVTQQGIGLSVTTPAQAAHTALLKPLTDAADNIDQIDLRVDVTGTLDAPEWRLHSDLGQQLQEQLQLAAERIVQEQATRLLAEADRRLGDELAELQQQLANEQAAFREQLGAGEQLLSELAEPIAARFQPLGKLLQRF